MTVISTIIANSNGDINTTQKWSFPLTIFSVNVTKSAVSYGFGHIYWINTYWKASFFCAANVIIFQGINVGGNSISDIVTGALYSLLHVCFKFERL